MLKTQRHLTLLKYLQEDRIVSVTDLAKKLGTSLMTIRRDLEALEEQGYIKKLHGGAMLIKNTGTEQPAPQHRISNNYEERKRIGAAAAELIKEHSAVLFDAGTTCLYAIDALPEALGFTAITTGLLASMRLCNKPHVHNIAIGGDVNKLAFSTVSSIAIEQIGRFHTDIAFITANAVSVPEGTYERLPQFVEIKQKIVENAEFVVLLADHNKFETKSLSLAVPMEKIDIIITDVETPEHVISQMRALGKKVIVV